MESIMAESAFYLLVLFENCLEGLIPQFRYADEILLFVLAAGAVFKAAARRGSLEGWNLFDWLLAGVFLLFLFVGTISTLLHSPGVPFSAVSKDVLLCGKFFAAFLCGKLLFLTADRDRMFKRLRTVTHVTVTVIFVCGVLSLFVDLGMGDQIRYGLRSYQFLYTHYTFLVYAEVLMTAVLCTGRARKEGWYIAMAVGTMLLTLRTKAVIFCLVFLLFLILEKYGHRIKIRYYVLAAAAGTAAAWGKIAEYLSWGFTYNMRNGLWMAGLKLAEAYFPLGSGFGSFGSNLSYEYSPQIYYDLGLGSFQGFEHGTPVLSDVFWPYIYGEFGVLGLLLFLFMMILLFKSLSSELDPDKARMRGANCIFAYLLVASTAEAVFTNSSGVFSAAILGICFRRTRAVQKEGTAAAVPRQAFCIRF